MKIELKEVRKAYGAEVALGGVNLVIEDGRALVLIGPSGGGKSTLLRLLGGLEVPDEGSLSVGGQSVPTDDRGLLAYRQGNGYLFQAFNLFPHMSLLRNIILPLVAVHGWEERAAAARAEECLERLGLGGQGEKTPGQLSGGQQQRGAIARAIAARPSLLILDEPTSALDPEMTAEVLAVIEELCATGQEIVMSTHEMGFAKAVADRVVFLAAGAVVEEGAELFEKAQTEAVQQFLSKVMRY